jgi:FkbM family methyltransferase
VKSFSWLKLWASINRFGTLRLANRYLHKLPTPTWVVTRVFGGQMHMDLSRSTAQQLLLLEGERFVEERSVLREMLRPGMTVVDVGANIGYYLLLFQETTGQGGATILIEPSEENLPELRRNIQANQTGRVLLHEVALGAEEGEIGLHAGINSGIADASEAAHVVKIRRLDSLVTERVDLLKIDVEGYEGQVLAGAGALIERSRPKIFLELHPHIVGKFGYSLRGILGDLSKHYQDIRLYEKRESGAGLLTKFGVRYLGWNGLRRIEDTEAYLERYSKDSPPHTFWAVCEPGATA